MASARLEGILAAMFEAEFCPPEHKQAREQGPVGLHVGQFAEHSLHRLMELVIPALDLVVQGLHLARQAVGEVAFELAYLVRQRTQALFQELVLLAMRALDLLVGVAAQVLLLA